MELLAANRLGRTRSVTWNGRDYRVVPMRMLVSGVLNGSKGPLYYPPDEVSRNVDAWNGMPLVLRHPTVNGRPVSARSPEVLERFGMGYVFNVKVADGVLDGEGWFDVEKTRLHDRTLSGSLKILPRIDAGLPVELSTGLFTQDTPVRNGYDPRSNRRYVAVARNYRPDHLAVLPDQAGACSLADGCGVLVGNTDQPRDELGRFSRRASEASRRASGNESYVHREARSLEYDDNDDTDDEVVAGLHDQIASAHENMMRGDDDHATAAKAHRKAAAARRARGKKPTNNSLPINPITALMAANAEQARDKIGRFASGPGGGGSADHDLHEKVLKARARFDGDSLMGSLAEQAGAAVITMRKDQEFIADHEHTRDPALRAAVTKLKKSHETLQAVVDKFVKMANIS